MLKDNRFLRFLLIWLLLLVVFIPRFWNFWTVDFTGDEAAHVRKAVSVATGVRDFIKLDNLQVAFKNIYTPIMEHNHPPLEFLILIPFGLLEPKEYFARLVYILIGTFALIFSYFFAKNIFGKKTAGYFFIFYGTSAYAIWWVQTAIYINLAISAGVFITLSIVNFYFKPDRKSLLLLFGSEAFGLLVFHDFIFFLPAVVWIIWDKRSFLKRTDFTMPVILFFLTAGVFYLNHIIYAFTVGPKYAGFNYVLDSKIPAQANIVTNLKGYWRNFFSYPGVVILLPFSALFLFFSEKHKYYKYFCSVLLIYIFVFVLKSPTPFHYFSSTYGILLLMAAIGISHMGSRIRPAVIAIVMLINLLGFWRVFGGIHNPQFIDSFAPNNAEGISKIAKKCVVSDNETYISSDDPWKTAYYFGRPSTVERDGTGARIATIGDFLAGRLDEVVLIHVGDNLITREEHEKLSLRAHSKFLFDRETVYIFKNCM